MSKIILQGMVTGILAVLAWIDHKTMEIPDLLNILLLLCGFAAIFLCPGVSFIERCIGAFCISVPMYLFCLLIPEAFGDGDIFLVSAMGFYLGWRSLLTGMFIGFLVGGTQACYLLASGKAAPGKREHMAFGPALCVGFVAAQYFGTDILRWYFGLFI